MHTCDYEYSRKYSLVSWDLLGPETAAGTIYRMIIDETICKQPCTNAPGFSRVEG